MTNYNPGDYHYLPAGEYHITPLPEDQPIVTLVRTSRQLFTTPTYVLREINRELQLTNIDDRPQPNKKEAERIWDELQPVIKRALS